MKECQEIAEADTMIGRLIAEQEDLLKERDRIEAKRDTLEKKRDKLKTEIDVLETEKYDLIEDITG